MESLLSPTPYRLVIELPGLPKSPNGSVGDKFTVSKERKKWRIAVSLLTRGKRPPLPLTRVAITCTRFSSVPMDFDNRVASFKACIDGLKDAGIIQDDKDSVVLRREYPQGISTQGEGFIRIEVRELTDDDLNLCLACGK